MIYILVLFGSFAGICLILGARVLLKTRSVRKFVHSIRQRTDSMEDRTTSESETTVEKPKISPRTSAIELQKVRTLLRTAEKVLARGKTDEAEKLLIEALTVRADARDVQAELARLYLMTERYAKAEALLKDLLKTNPETEFFAQLGLASFKQGKLPQACQAYQCAFERDDKNPERAAALGQAYVVAGELEQGLPLLQKAAERMARDTDLLRLIAECCVKLGDREAAYHAFVRINKLVPYDEEVKAKLVALARA